jgi:hypothetical protein
MRRYKGGGSSTPAPQEVTTQTSNLPEYVEPYYKRLLQRGEAESLQGYTPYGGQRLEYFAPDELTSQAMVRGFAQSGTPQQFTDASQRYGSQTALDSGYQAGTTQSGYDAAAMGQGYRAGQAGPTYQADGYDPSYQAGRFDSGYQAGDRASQYQAGQVGGQYNPMNYEQNIDRFMSPYQQNVIDIEKREARRASDIAAKQGSDAATQAGGLGGYREAIMQAERERNLGQQLGDIQSRGSQKAFESAQQQLERERASGMGAARFGLEQFGAQQQALQSQEQMAQASFNASEQARQQAASMGMNAQQQEEAARQAQEKFAQSGYGATQQAMQAQGAQELDAYRAQQQAMQAQGSQGIQAYQAGEQARQQAAKLGLTADQQNEAARQAQEKFSQSAYDLSNRYNLASAQGLMQTGQGIQQDAISRMQMLENIGRQERAIRQAGRDIGYEDFLRQKDFTQNQLGRFSNLLRGVPIQPQQTQSTYQQQPGLFQTALGAGLSGLGLYRGFGGGG